MIDCFEEMYVIMNVIQGLNNSFYESYLCFKCEYFKYFSGKRVSFYLRIKFKEVRKCCNCILSTFVKHEWARKKEGETHEMHRIRVTD